jgi:uncharacterized phage protein gp47/JayE
LSAPVLDPRKQADVLAALTRDLPGYTPEWTPGPASPGLALMKIFARFAGILIGGVNRVPDRNQLAFLDAMGIHLLPAQAAEAPLVFTLAQTSPVDVTLPANSQVAAPPQPAVPSVATADPPQIASSQPVPFATMESISLSRAKLATLYSIDPGSDEYADHSASLTTGFTLFENMGLTEHAIYLGHDTLFAFNGSIKLLLLIGLRAGADTALSIQWEYLASTGWVALSSAPEDDTTGGLQQDGTIIVQRDCGPAAKLDTFAGQKSYWVRGRLTAPLLPDNQLGGKRTVPVINSFLVRISTTQSGLAPEASFADSVALDVSKDFYPFGQQPARSSTFYLASTEVFQRSAANVQISIKLSQDGVTQGNFTLVWEYFNGSEWSGLGIQSDSTDPSGYLFTKDANLSFLCPRDWQPTKVNGVKNYWLRAWIKSGSYGSPVRVNLPPATDITAVSSDGLTLTVNSIDGYNGGEQVTIVDSHSATPMGNSIQQAQSPNKLVVTSSIAVTYSGGQVLPPAGLPLLASPSLQPPIITSLKLSYTFLTDPELLNHCLSKNDFVFEDDTEASLWPDQTFTPFHPVMDVQPAVHFGFDHALPAGLASLFLDIPESVAQDSGPSPFLWEYLSVNGWSELGVLDETQGFQSSGMLQLVGQPDAISAPGLGGNLYWVRARLKQGELPTAATVSGVWLNAVWASQRTSTATELAGASDGNPGQAFGLQHTPVLEGELVEVQEWTGSGDGWQSALQDVPQSDLRLQTDSATGLVTAVWVRWTGQPNLYNSGPQDRHYTIERATGSIRFGPPGMIPPGGSSISVTYDSGGGAAGNVPAGAISELHTSVPYVQSVANPIAASGGADMESNAAVAARGPQAIRNRDRAVSTSDFEWLARQASPDVGRVRCIPITGPDGHAQRGWVTLVVVPRTLDAQPQPTPEFQLRVLNYLAARAPVAAMRQIRIAGPSYAPVGIWAEVVASDVNQLAQLEAVLRNNLNRFLHPLTGGALGQGWEFGQPVYLSQIASVIEATPGVDYATAIVLRMNGQVYDNFVPVPADTLIAAGTHELKLALA